MLMVCNFFLQMPSKLTFNYDIHSHETCYAGNFIFLNSVQMFLKIQFFFFKGPVLWRIILFNMKTLIQLEFLLYLESVRAEFLYPTLCIRLEWPYPSLSECIYGMVGFNVPSLPSTIQGSLSFRGYPDPPMLCLFDWIDNLLPFAHSPWQKWACVERKWLLMISVLPYRLPHWNALFG